MAVYATAADLVAYTADNEAVTLPGDPQAVERLLLRGERAVDAVVGAWPLYSDGRKFSPPLLAVTQSEALKRATCAACEHELIVGLEVLAGDADLLPTELQVVTRAALTSPRMLRELAGSGLIRTSGTVVPDPKPLTTAPLTAEPTTLRAGDGSGLHPAA